MSVQKKTFNEKKKKKIVIFVLIISSAKKIKTNLFVREGVHFISLSYHKLFHGPHAVKKKKLKFPRCNP